MKESKSADKTIDKKVKNKKTDSTNNKKIKIVEKKKTTNKEKTKNHTHKGIKGFRNELDKVKWPSKKDMLRYSIATVIFVIFFGVFFYLIELLMALIKSLV